MSTSIAYSTDSAGMHAYHTLPKKLRAIAAAGFDQAELGFPDLEAYAEQEYHGYQQLNRCGKGDLDKLILAAENIKALCDELHLAILAVHPFDKYEGYQDETRRAAGVERAAAWFNVLKALGCDMLQVGSTPDESTSGDYDVIARDLRQLADIAAAQQPPIRIAYELWAWGAHVNRWEHAWEVCKRVDRPNFGLCLDTFQICARDYTAHATHVHSLTGSFPSGSAMAKLSSSLNALSATIPAEKIFYFQISDGSRNFDPETLKRTAAEQGISPLYAWSNAWRPLPYMDDVCSSGLEQGWGGYLPVLDVCEAVLKTGWRGPWSYEVFYEKDMAQDDRTIPEKWATAAKKSHDMILEKLQRRGA